MTVTPSFRTFVLEQLGRVLPQVRARAMFGGVGIYTDDLFFAIIAEDVVYFKVDDVTRADFEAAGMAPFRPYGETGEVMRYCQIPADLLEDVEELRPWVTQAVAAARRSNQSKRSRRGGA